MTDDETRAEISEFLAGRLALYAVNSNSGDPAVAILAREEFQHFTLLSNLFDNLGARPDNSEITSDIDNLTKAVAEITERLVSLETATPPTIPPDLLEPLSELTTVVQGLADRVATLETTPTPKPAKA